MPLSTRPILGLVVAADFRDASSCNNSWSVKNLSGSRASNSVGALGVNAQRTVVVSPGTSLPSWGVTTNGSVEAPKRQVRVPWWWFVSTTSLENGTRRVASGVKMRSPKSTVVWLRTSIGLKAEALH